MEAATSGHALHATPSSDLLLSVARTAGQDRVMNSSKNMRLIKAFEPRVVFVQPSCRCHAAVGGRRCFRSSIHDSKHGTWAQSAESKEGHRSLDPEQLLGGGDRASGKKDLLQRRLQPRRPRAHRCSPRPKLQRLPCREGCGIPVTFALRSPCCSVWLATRSPETGRPPRRTTKDVHYRDLLPVFYAGSSEWWAHCFLMFAKGPMLLTSSRISLLMCIVWGVA